ncbi:MAG: sugar transferase [Candidatus Magasanikbacteria bacterium]|nr:sugar transferase [Candidatus Magasanikbacteria bacterium]
MRFIYRFKQIILLSGDILSLLVGFWLSFLIRNFHLPTLEKIESHLPLFSVIFIIWILNNYINGLYDLIKISKKETFYRRFVETAILSLVVGVFFFYLINNSKIAPKTLLLLNVFTGYSLSFLWRLLFRKFSGIRKLQTNVLLVGYTKDAKELIDIFEKNPERGYKIVGLIEPNKIIKSSEFSFDVYYNLNTIRPAITNHNAHLVVISPNLKDDHHAMREFYELLFWKVQINDLSSFYEVATGRIPPFTFSEGWFLQHLRHHENTVYEKFKTVLDFFGAVLIFIIFALALPFIAIGIKATSKGPVFFKQKRIGRFGKHFMIYKFRSMFALSKDGSAEIDGATFAKKGDKRITSFGKFLRKTRLDELPQAINMLKGEIGLVGPRPERPEITKKLEEQMPYYSLRHVVKPGLTGWAVINQNYTDTMESSLQKLQYDLFYIKNRSIFLDVSILLKTVNLVIRFMGQ